MDATLLDLLETHFVLFWVNAYKTIYDKLYRLLTVYMGSYTWLVRI